MQLCHIKDSKTLIDLLYRCLLSDTPGQRTHRGVFAKLAEGREGFLMGLTDLFNDGLQLCRQLVALCQLRLRAVLLLLIPVIANS